MNILKNDDDLIIYDTETREQIVQQHIDTFDLVSENDPILREKLPLFDFETSTINPADFASSMVETCRKFNGYGLSANQCGFRHRMFVMGAGKEYVAFFNPVLVKSEGEAHIQEACLSFPMLGLRITRPEKIWVKYQDFTGEEKEAHFTGLSARCFLHELDHMDGIVYTTRAKPLALQSGLKKRAKLQKMMTRYFKAQQKMAQVAR